MTEITELLQAIGGANQTALRRAFEVVYAELKGLAHAQRRRLNSQTLSTTALVHETWIKFSQAQNLSARDREHFFCLAARAMRQVLLDRARAAASSKRPDPEQKLTLDEHLPLEDGALGELADDMFDLDRALGKLVSLDAKLAELVELHLFAGLEFAEIAEMRGVSERTALRDWRKARAILGAELGVAAVK